MSESEEFTCCGENIDMWDKKHKEKICIKVPEVIGRNCTQIFIESVIPFPQQYPAVALKDVQKEIKELKVFVCKNKVMINGILHKNINYKTYECDLENEAKNDKCDCKYDMYYGSVRHVGVDIPFGGFIEVPGARKGDKYQIEYAGVEDCCEVDIFEDPIHVPKSSVCLYKCLREKMIIKIDLKVLREIQITVKPEECNICP